MGDGDNPLSLDLERQRRLARSFRIAEAYRAGVAVKDIMDEYGCSKNTVLRVARMFGIPRRPKAFDPAKRALVVRMIEEGKPYKEISAYAKCSEGYVSIVAKEEGLMRYGPQPKRRPPDETFEEYLNRVTGTDPND